MQQVLTQRQIDIVRASVPRMKNNTPFNFYLFNLMIAMPLYMGAASKEMLQMRVEDIDLKATHIKVGAHVIPFHPQMRKLIRKYLAYRAARLPDGEDHGYLLVRAGGRGNNTGRDGAEKYNVSNTMLLRYYRDISKVSRVKVTHKLLRDTYGYHLALSGAPHHVIMGAMGCTYETALRMISLASKTVSVDDWYMEAMATVRPYREKL